MNTYDTIITKNGAFKYKSSIKEDAFKYIVFKLIDWWIKENPNKPFSENNLGKLKVHKILFFVVASSSDRDNVGLLKLFNNWVAVPYGHFEKDIIDLIDHKNGDFDWFKIDNNKITLKMNNHE